MKTLHAFFPRPVVLLLEQWIGRAAQSPRPTGGAPRSSRLCCGRYPNLCAGRPLLEQLEIGLPPPADAGPAARRCFCIERPLCWNEHLTLQVGRVRLVPVWEQTYEGNIDSAPCGELGGWNLFPPDRMHTCMHSLGAILGCSDCRSILIQSLV